MEIYCIFSMPSSMFFCGDISLPHFSSPFFTEVTRVQMASAIFLHDPTVLAHDSCQPISVFSWEECSFLCDHEGVDAIASSCVPDCEDLLTLGQHKTNIQKESRYITYRKERDRESEKQRERQRAEKREKLN